MQKLINKFCFYKNVVGLLRRRLCSAVDYNEQMIMMVYNFHLAVQQTRVLAKK